MTVATENWEFEMATQKGTTPQYLDRNGRTY
jgi:hypothetical protein